MKKEIFLLALIWFSQNAMSCDVCGCSLGGFSQGVMPYFNSHVAGIKYNQAIFQSQINHNSINGGIESSFDQYSRFEFFGRYTLKDRLKISFSLPYVYNRMSGTHESLKSAGVGDPILLLQYQLLKKERILKNHFLIVGGGLKLPAGKYNLEENNQLVNRSFQPGTGSVDFISNINYFFRKNKSGLMIESAYKMNTQNRFKYRFGNQFNATVNYVFITGKNQFNLIAFSGLYFETAAQHHENSNTVFNTGGSALYANFGTQFYLNKLRLGTGFQYPICQNYNTDSITQIQAGMRLAIDILFFFGKK